MSRGKIPIIMNTSNATEHYSLFPTLVIKTPGFLTLQECTKIYKLVIKKKKEIQMAPHGTISGENSGSSFDSSSFLRHNKSLKIIEKKILDKATEYAKQAGYRINKVMDHSWFNIQNKGSKLKQHSHPLSTFSGGLYINCDEKSSPLCFHSPNSFIYFTHTIQKVGPLPPFAYQWVYFKPKKGDLFLFPSFLMHGSHEIPNETENRIVISFNIT